MRWEIGWCANIKRLITKGMHYQQQLRNPAVSVMLYVPTKSCDQYMYPHCIIKLVVLFYYAAWYCKIMGDYYVSSSIANNIAGVCVIHGP